MAVKRIVANIAAAEVAVAKAFYGDILGMDVVMDHGWIVTFAAAASASPQISIANEGGSGTPVPDLSIEVDILPRFWPASAPPAFQFPMDQCGSHGASIASMSAIRSGASSTS